MINKKVTIEILSKLQNLGLILEWNNEGYPLCHVSYQDALIALERNYSVDQLASLLGIKKLCGCDSFDCEVVEEVISNQVDKVGEVITDWKAVVGEEKISDRGITYSVIPIANRRDNFLNLLQTMVDRGLTADEIKSATVSTKVVKTCWSDLITKMTARELRKARDITRRQWEDAQKEFFSNKVQNASV